MNNSSDMANWFHGKPDHSGRTVFTNVRHSTESRLIGVFALNPAAAGESAVITSPFQRSRNTWTWNAPGHTMIERSNSELLHRLAQLIPDYFGSPFNCYRHHWWRRLVARGGDRSHAVGGSLLLLSRPFADILPAQCHTLGGLAKATVGLNYGRLVQTTDRPMSGRWPKLSDVWLPTSSTLILTL
jgi:hypothetical protein